MQTQADTILESILSDRRFIRAVAKAVIEELGDDGPSASTPEELQQMKADLLAGRIKPTPWREALGEACAI
jgi:hypothetical protein